MLKTAVVNFSSYSLGFVCVCVRACVRACVRVCVCATVGRYGLCFSLCLFLLHIVTQCIIAAQENHVILFILYIYIRIKYSCLGARIHSRAESLLVSDNFGRRIHLCCLLLRNSSGLSRFAASQPPFLFFCLFCFLSLSLRGARMTIRTTGVV